MKLFEEEDRLRESSESVPLVVVVEEGDGDVIKTPSWIDLTIASRDSRFLLLFLFSFFWYRETKSGAFEETLKEYLKRVEKKEEGATAT